MSRYTDPTNPDVASLVAHLRRAGFVDPDDDTVPLWPPYHSHEAPVWVDAQQLAATVLGWVRDGSR